MYKDIVFLVLLVAFISVIGPNVEEDEAIKKLIEEARERANSYRKDKASEELKRLTTIRIFIPDAPNFGHQSAAIALLDQLTSQSDPKGDVEVVYEKAVEKRLQTLKPGFETLKGKIEFIEKAKFNGKFEENGISFVAASETGCSELEAKQLLELMKVPCGAFLQPYAWTGGRRCLACKDSYKEDGKVIVEEPSLLESSSYIYDVELPKSLHEFFKRNVYSNKAVPESDTNKYRVIEYILNQLLGEKTELMVLYGIHQVYWERENVLINIQGGVQQAELKRPSILLLFGQDILKPRAEGVLYSIEDLTVRTIENFVSGENEGRQMTILGDQVIQPVFQLACKLSTLPMVFEGANTANLAYMLEKPFISVKDAYTPLPIVKEETGRSMLKDLVEHIKDDISWTKRHNKLKKYAKMLITLRRAKDALDSSEQPAQHINVVKTLFEYLTLPGNTAEILDSFIVNLKEKCEVSLKLSKRIFPLEFYTIRSGDGILKISGKLQEVIEQLIADIRSYKAEFRRGLGLGELTSEVIGKHKIYEHPEITEDDTERWEANKEIEEIALRLKKMEINALRNSLELYLDAGLKADDIIEGWTKIELQPPAKAANLVKNIIEQARHKDSDLSQYYKQVFEIPKKLENNQLLQSLYLISTMQTPKREKLVRCLANKIYDIFVRLLNLHRDSKKRDVGLSPKTKFMLKSRIKEYDFLQQDRKTLRERLFMLSELNSGLKETLSAVVDDLRRKMKSVPDKSTEKDVNQYLNDFTSFLKKLDEWENELRELFGPNSSMELCE